ncbi:MAG: hypothetical protein NVSMB52_00090 [Chloroflexota bacterium]
MQYARNYGEFERLEAQLAGISVDSIADNAEMVGKLSLPFPLLSDANGALIQRFNIWNEGGHIAVPALVVLDRAGKVVYSYSGHDFADRPGDGPLFDALRQVHRGEDSLKEEPEIRVSAADAQHSVGPEKRAMSLQELLSYYQGAFFASVALKGRVAAMGEKEHDAVSEISRYQAMVRGYRDALQATLERSR